MGKVEFQDIQDTIDTASSGLNEIIDSVNQFIREARKTVDQGNVVSSSNTVRHTESGEYKNQKFMPPQLYKKTSGEETGATVQSVLGFTIAGGGLLTGAIATLISVFNGSGFLWIFLSALALVGGILIGAGGLKRGKRAKKFNEYLKILGSRTYVTTQELMEKTGKSEKQIEEDLRDLIEQRYFKQGHLDAANDYFITSDETFKNYEAILKAKQASSEAEEEKDKLLRASGLSNEGVKLVKQGEAYLNRISHLNAEIPDKDMTEKLQTMESLIKEILYAVRKNPTSASELRKMMNYYLPTTEKLLTSYQELDRRPEQTSSVKNTKKEIEKTLGTMNDAFSQILGKLFRDENWDVETDISALNTMLELEGLKKQERELKTETN